MARIATFLLEKVAACLVASGKAPDFSLDEDFSRFRPGAGQAHARCTTSAASQYGDPQQRGCGLALAS